MQELVREAFLRGISTRQVGSVRKPVVGEAYSAQTLSRIARGLDAAAERVHRRALQDECLCPFLDGVVLRVRDGRGNVRRWVALVAYGITAAGRRELVSCRSAQGDSEAAWTRFLQDPYLRGLEGKRLRLVVSDGSAGATSGGRQWLPEWSALEELLSFFSAPEAHWREVRTTNVFERAFREVWRRTRPMSGFTNLDSCDRIIFGVVNHLNRSWEKVALGEFTQDS